MYNFLVLGIIPGTNIEITFPMWCEAAALVITALYLRYHVLQRQLTDIPNLPFSDEVLVASMQLSRLAQRTHRKVAALQVGSAVRRSASHLRVFASVQSTLLRGYLARHSSNVSE